MEKTKYKKEQLYRRKPLEFNSKLSISDKLKDKGWEIGYLFSIDRKYVKKMTIFCYINFKNIRIGKKVDKKIANRIFKEIKDNKV